MLAEIYNPMRYVASSIFIKSSIPYMLPQSKDFLIQCLLKFIQSSIPYMLAEIYMLPQSFLFNVV